MNVQTHFDQASWITAANLEGALVLMDEGKQDEARALIAEVQKAHQEQADVIDPRIHDAIRRLCETRQMDSRRLLALLLALGLREVGRNLMIGYCPDLIAHHRQLENDLFSHLLGQFPRNETGAIHGDDVRNTGGIYQNGNQRLWDAFCAAQETTAAPEVQP